MKKLLSFVPLLSVIMLVGAACSTPGSVTPTTTPATSTSDVPAGWERVDNEAGRYMVSYPKNIFTATVAGATTSLKSPYHVVENPSGIPGNEMQHYFAISLNTQKGTVIDVINKSPFKDLLLQSFPGNTTSSFIPSEGFARTVEVSGNIGYGFTLGVEGTNTEYIFVPKKNYDADKDTLVITFSYVSDFLKDSIKPSAIAEAEQKRILNEVLNDIRFVEYLD